TSRWTPGSASLTASWSAQDSLGEAGSGSALVSNIASTAGAQLELSQCVVLSSPAASIFIAGRARVPSGQARTGQVFFAGRTFANATCTSPPISVSTTGGPTSFDAWIFGGAGVIGPGVQSVLLSVELKKNEAGGTFQAYVDNIVVRASTPSVLTIPASASIQGNNSTFFQTDLWISNRSLAASVRLSLTYRCFAGQTCSSTPKTFILGPEGQTLFQNAVGSYFAAPSTAGAIEISYDAGQAPVVAFSRTYTPSLPAPTNGTGIPALAQDDVRTRTVFVGLAHNGGDLSSGFRTNAGVYNPRAAAITVTFSLYNQGALVGAPLTRTWAAQEPYQVNDIFTAVGAGGLVTRNATLVVTATGGVFPYVTVIDNQSGDSVYVPAQDERAPE
ncbi:MAG: hypothetical protein ABIT01_04015, partial [Thermoanaerobaculia bacterium]